VPAFRRTGTIVVVASKVQTLEVIRVTLSRAHQRESILVRVLVVLWALNSRRVGVKQY
jgi:hypothetical protein